ncbi:hypothetical protein [Natronomonas marina]|uniref:hypothetical protein n=1 Tax=Natronomonas marina TaxID=2961939 RepID=UPI0020C95CC1|nr:hypothetical protein [Natronomonas marina]
MSSREATVQGEFHAGATDARALLERDGGLESYDAVLVEGRSPTLVVRELTLGYAAFLMGYVTLMWVQAAVARVRGRTEAGATLREAADRADAAFHDRIDADTATVYEMVPTPARYLFGAWLVSLLAVAVVAGLNRPLLVVLSLSVPYLYTTLAIVFVKVSADARASYMADRIDDLAAERSYDRVAVLCGDAHRTAVGEALEEREWSVTTHRTRHPLGRLFRW